MYELRINWRYRDKSGIHIEKDDMDWDTDAADAEWLKGLKFQWFEGNFSCDCNRSIFIFPEEHCKEDDPDMLCGEEITFEKVDFYRNCRLIGTGSDAEYKAIVGRRWWDKLQPAKIS